MSKRYKILKGTKVWRAEKEFEVAEPIIADRDVVYDENEVAEHRVGAGENNFVVISLPESAAPYRFLQVYMKDILIMYEGV